MSNVATPPDAPFGSPERKAYWAQYWAQWGSSDETHREQAGLIQDLEEDIATLQTQNSRYAYYIAQGDTRLDWNQIIQTNNVTISNVSSEITRLQSQFVTSLQSVGKQ